MATTDEQRTTRHLRQALAILDTMDDNITSCGGDEDEHGRRELARIRRLKDHLRKAAPSTADLGLHRNPNAKKTAVAVPDEGALVRYVPQGNGNYRIFGPGYWADVHMHWTGERWVCNVLTCNNHMVNAWDIQLWCEKNIA